MVQVNTQRRVSWRRVDDRRILTNAVEEHVVVTAAASISVDEAISNAFEPKWTLRHPVDRFKCGKRCCRTTASLKDCVQRTDDLGLILC